MDRKRSIYEWSSHYYVRNNGTGYAVYSSRWGEAGILRKADGFECHMQGDEADKFLAEVDLAEKHGRPIDDLCSDYDHILQAPQE